MPSYRSRISIGVLLVGLLAAVPIYAQNLGTVRGDVRAPDGEPLPGVLVQVTGPLVRGQRVMTTGPSGAYLFAGLTPGLFTITASLEGLETSSAEDVRISISATSIVDFELRPESVEEQITVISERPIVDTTNSLIQTTFDQELLDALPTNRQMSEYAEMMPGITSTGRDATYGMFRQSAYGRDPSSNQWNIDGLDSSNADWGGLWWLINPDLIAEVQVLGVGMPAEYGSLSGAAINIITKSGTNQFRGRLSTFRQFDATTASGPTGEGYGGAETSFERESYADDVLTLGGALKKDKLFFLASIEDKVDGMTEPGQNPDMIGEDKLVRYDLKLDWSINQSNTMSLSTGYEQYAWQSGGGGAVDPFQSEESMTYEFGIKKTWRLGVQSILSSSTFLEANAAGWWNYDRVAGVTGSVAPAFVDYTLGPNPVSLGGPKYPYDYPPKQERANVKITHFADELGGGSHEFKFGIQYSQMEAYITALFPSFGSKYYFKYNMYGYDYYFIYTRKPHYYGSESDQIGAFVQDSWKVSDNVTLNLGVRWDSDGGGIPAYPILESHLGGENQGVGTGEFHPAYSDLFKAETFSPRIGLAYQTSGGVNPGVLRASISRYNEGVRPTNWEGPHPNRPQARFGFSRNRYGPFFYYRETSDAQFDVPDPNLKAPETDEYAISYEKQLGRSLSVGLEVMKRDTKNLIGWQILDDGVYSDFAYVNPATGETITLMNILVEPTRRKGNDPGPGANLPEGTKYDSQYRGYFLTLKKRHIDRWSIQASLGWSESKGRGPRPLSQRQNDGFFSGTTGSDPNHHINGDGLYQNDREWIFQTQGLVDLPWKMQGVFSLRVQDGRPYTQQARVRLSHGLTRINLESAHGDQRLPSSVLLDLGIGRRFALGSRAGIGVDLQGQNMLNDDGWDMWNQGSYQDGEFTPVMYQMPRRLILRLSLNF